MRRLALLVGMVCLPFAGCSDSSSGQAGDLAVYADSGDDLSMTDAGGADATDGAAPDGTAADAATGPRRIAITDLVFKGAFRLSSGTFGVSNTNYAVGVLGYNPDNNSLFIAGHAQHNALAEFDIPTPSMKSVVKDLPEVFTPRQDFVKILDRPSGGNPDQLDRITGMLYVGGKLIVNAETWYDAPGDNKDTTMVIQDASDLAGSQIDGYYQLAGAARAGGYLFSIPSAWRQQLGGDYATGWSSVYSIISRYSIGPSLFVFDPTAMLGGSATMPVTTTALMDFPFAGQKHLDPTGLDTQQGSASDLWNHLSRGVYGVILPGTKTFAVFGSSGGVDTGIGYKITQDNGNLCGGYCSYGYKDNYNYYWFFDVDEILAAKATHEPRPYAYGRWKVPFDGGHEHEIIGGTFDPKSGTLYFALGGAGQVGDYDRPPLILTYQAAAQ